MISVLAAVFLAVPARAEGTLSFRSDVRLEAVAAAEAAAGGRARGFVDPKSDYSREVAARMKPLRDDPAVKYQASLPKAFDFAARCDIADRLSLDLQSTTSYFLPDPTTNLAGGTDKVEAWLAGLRSLSAKADLPGLYAARRAELDALAEPFRKSAEDMKVVARIEAYAGRPVDSDYRVTVSPFFDEERMLDSVWRRPDGTRELHTVVGASAGRRHGSYYFQERFPSALWHQLSHGYWDERVEAARDDLATRTDGRKDPCFGAWEQCVKENLVRAVTARLMEQAGGPRAAKRFLYNGDEDLYPLMPRLIERLKEYEANRDKYPTLDAFLPRLFDVFPRKDAR
jgi:hypothetical protein